MRAQQGQPVDGESAGIDVRAPVRSGALEFAGGRLLSGRPFKFGQIRLHLPREVLLFLLRVVPRQGVVGILRHVVLPPGFAGVRCCGQTLIHCFVAAGLSWKEKTSSFTGQVGCSCSVSPSPFSEKTWVAK